MLYYHWPGNIRELENCIERAVLLTTDGIIYEHHLPLLLHTAEDKSSSPQNRLRTSLAALEQEMIMDALRTAGGNGVQAAQVLGISERLIRLRIAKYHIDSKSFKRIAASRHSGQRSIEARKQRKSNISVELS
jgi:Nif-specific regulatory protein